jgi:hypothetical protein
MRFFYLLLSLILPYSLWIYYPRKRFINKPKKYFGRTIYVSNHAASFMDPLVIGGLQRPIVFFMTRSDVFKSALKPILWMAHMLPIYRQHDGEDTKQKNDETFQKCTKVLKGNRNLLIFGEGFTDDIFIRRLKPLKKGAARIGFGTLEALEWKEQIFMAAVGVNYGDPNFLGSDLVISNSESICLNDYREIYEANPSKAINEVTKRIEKMLQAQLTHVENLNWVFFHEHISRLLRNGLHPIDPDLTIPLEQRWENSRKLAAWINAQKLDENPELVQLKENLDAYFNDLKKQKISDKLMRHLVEKKKRMNITEWFYFLLCWPFVLLGFIHTSIPYIFIKRFTEKTFKRKVFWSSVKMMLGVVSIGIWNIPIVLLMHYWLIKPQCTWNPNSAWIISVFYYFIIPIFGLITYKYLQKWKEIKGINKLRNKKHTYLLAKRLSLLKALKDLGVSTLFR